jgi:hypothetical protein
MEGRVRGGEAWEACSREVGTVRARSTVKSGRQKCELGCTCDARSMDCECRWKIKVEYRLVSSICRSSAHAGGHRSRGLSEARRRGHARSMRARLRVRGSKVPMTPKVGVWRSVSGRVMHVQGDGARAKARVHTHRVERAMCSGAGVRNWDAEGRRRHWRAGGKQQAALL